VRHSASEHGENFIIAGPEFAIAKAENDQVSLLKKEAGNSVTKFLDDVIIIKNMWDFNFEFLDERVGLQC
jgi:hypothetical protein